MIPATHGVNHALTTKTPIGMPIADAAPFAIPTAPNSAAPVAAPTQGSAQASSIAGDLGQLTTDTLTLMGLGAKPGPNAHASQATQAYAASRGLIH